MRGFNETQFPFPTKAFFKKIADLEPQLYFATRGDGVKKMLTQSPEVSTFVSTYEGILGVTYDTLRNKLYWSSSTLTIHKIPLKPYEYNPPGYHRM